MKRKIKNTELKITHVKGGGPGGQNRNKRSTGVRVEHLTTGIRAVATERRSQQMNLQNALERLSNKLEIKLKRPKERKATAPSASSQRHRLREKERHAERKRLRGKKRDQWDD